MYGHVKGDPVSENRVYLIDLDIVYSNSNDIFRDLSGLYDSLIEMEQRLGGLKLHQAREKLSSFLKSVDQSDLRSEEVSADFKALTQKLNLSS